MQPTQMLAEAEVVITIDLDEFTTQLYGLTRKPPCFLIMDETPIIYHTIFNLFHCGATHFTLLARTGMEADVESFITTAHSQKGGCINTGLDAATFNAVYIQEGESSFQAVCRVAAAGGFTSQNIVFLQSTCYFDVPLQQIIDCHRRMDATMTIVHACEQPDGRNFDMGCVCIENKLESPYMASEVNYALTGVSYYENLSRDKLTDQKTNMIKLPLSAVRGTSEIKAYQQRPVGIILATEVIKYLSGLNLELYEGLIRFFCEQQMLDDELKHESVKKYLGFALEKPETQNDPFTDLVSNHATSTSITGVTSSNIDLSVQIAKLKKEQNDFEAILAQFSETLLDVNMINTITTAQSRKLVVSGFQMNFPEIVKTCDTTEHFQSVTNKIEQFFKAITTIEAEQHEKPKANPFQTLGERSALDHKQSAARLRRASTSTMNMYTTKSNHTQPQYTQGYLDLSSLICDLNGGIFQINSRESYLWLSGLLQKYAIRRLFLWPEMSVKVHLTNYKKWEYLRSEPGDPYEQVKSETRQTLVRQRLWISNRESMYAVDMKKMQFCTVHGQKMLEKDNQSSLAICGSLNNCVIEQSVTITADVKMQGCVVMRGAVIDGTMSFKNCIIGPGCYITGGGSYVNCVFKKTCKHHGADEKQTVVDQELGTTQ